VYNSIACLSTAHPQREGGGEREESTLVQIEVVRKTKNEMKDTAACCLGWPSNDSTQNGELFFEWSVTDLQQTFMSDIIPSKSKPTVLGS
jgi:hypothetical protein